ncbi:MAG TPA: hypothetical protein VIO11_06050 [Candidatus Methanoperedens sp.]
MVFLLMFLIPPVNAYYEGIFKILDERYMENASDLPESKDLKPDMNWQSSGDITAWIDIVGFRRMIREDGREYLPGKPENYAILQYEAKGALNCGKCSYECKVDKITKEHSVRSEGNLTVAQLDVIIKWHRTVCTGSNGAEDVFSTTATPVYWDGKRTTYYTESATFYDYEISPELYPALNEPEVIITQYNNSMYENIGIKIINDNYTKISFRYRDKQAVRTLEILHVENNSKGVTYGNIMELEQWKIEGTNISRFYNEILLDGNLSKMDMNEFDIWIYNPYTSRKADPKNFKVQRIEFAPQRTINGLLIAVIGMVSTFTIGTLYLYNRAVYKWKLKLF